MDLDITMSDDFVGRHLLLDVQTASPRGLCSAGTLYQILEGLSECIEMTLVYPPIVGTFPFASGELERFVGGLKNEGVDSATLRKMDELLARRGKDKAGVSGVAVWLESHCSVHTWTEHNFFSFDAYSCKEFDVSRVMEFLFGFFDIEAYNGLDIVRTLGSPQQIRRVSSPLDPSVDSAARAAALQAAMASPS
jgi:S-adenosylmethionine decarboxylase